MSLTSIPRDIFGIILAFIENDYIPIFRQVSQQFKEIAELEAERGEGILYCYGKFKRYRTLPPFDLPLSKYLISTDLFDWAIMNKFEFSCTLEEIGGDDDMGLGLFDDPTVENRKWLTVFLKSACKELLFKYVLQTDCEWIKRDSQLIFPQVIRRWHSIDDYRKLRELRFSARHPKSMIAAIQSKASIDIIKWLIDEGRCEFTESHLLSIIKEGNLELLETVMLNERLPTMSYDAIMYAASCDDKFEIFKWAYGHHHEQETMMNDDDELIHFVASSNGLSILNFLKEEGVITKVLSRCKDLARSFGKIKCLYWMSKNGMDIGTSISRFGLSQYFSNSSETEISDILTYFLLSKHLTISPTFADELLFFTVNNGHLNLFDRLFPFISVHVQPTIIYQIGKRWFLSFKSINRFAAIFSATFREFTKPIRNTSMQQFSLELANIGAFDHLQWLFDNEYLSSRTVLYLKVHMVDSPSRTIKEKFQQWMEGNGF